MATTYIEISGLLPSVRSCHALGKRVTVGKSARVAGVTMQKMSRAEGKIFEGKIFEV